MRLRQILFGFLLFICSMLSYSHVACAGSYSYYLGQLYTYYGMIGYSPQNINIVGFNDTQGFSKILPADVLISGSGQWLNAYLNYTLPDDGSYWRAQGNVVIMSSNGSSPEGGVSSSYLIYKIDTANSTPGSFSGYSPRTATASANTAATSASNAYSAANAARSSADSAAVNASNAYQAASSASAYTWDAVTSKSAATLSREARDQGQSANNKLDLISASITSIEKNMGGDVTPPLVRVRTATGATATSGSSIQAVLDISDNASSSFTYSLDNVTYTPLPASRVIFLPVATPGPNNIQVSVKDEAGNTGAASITIRRL